MKALMLIGALIGFLIGILFGIAGRGEGSDVFWRACTAALIAALLMRWWGRKWVEGLRDSLIQRERIARETEKAATNKPVKKL